MGRKGRRREVEFKENGLVDVFRIWQESKGQKGKTMSLTFALYIFWLIVLFAGM